VPSPKSLWAAAGWLFFPHCSLDRYDPDSGASFANPERDSSMMKVAALIDFLLTATVTSSTFAVPLIAIAAFASTNVDDLFLLASLFVDREFRTMPVVAGQFLGMSLLVAFGILAALFAVSIQGDWIYLLGLAPLLLGIGRLRELFKTGARAGLTNGNRSDFVGKEQLRSGWARSKIAFVALLTIANGGDNLSVYIPLFSIHRAFIPLYAVIFGLMTALWCLLGYYLVNHSLFGNRVKRYGRFIIPFILIGIGLNVLFHAYHPDRRTGAASRLPALTASPEKFQ
jgi:cadmium resistance protein CadD (predicted permease)